MASIGERGACSWPAEEYGRARHQAQRIRILTGLWREDIILALSRIYSAARAEALGEPDMSRNAALNVHSQLGITYDAEPVVTMEVDGEPLDASGMVHPRTWQMFQRLALFVSGLNECFVRLDWDTAGGTSVRIVPPDEVIPYAHPSRPSELVAVEWLRPRTIPAEYRTDIAEEWTWEVWDVSDPEQPVFRILSGDRKEDRTAWYVDASADPYPYRDTSGKPIFPWVVYHRAATGKIMDPFYGRELYEGTLRLACLWTGWSHGVVEASWPQRWGLNVEVPSATLVGEGSARRAEVVVDPTSVALFSGTNGQTGSLGQFQPGLDVAATSAALSQYERDLAVYAGLSPGDLMATGDAQSGYAISVSRDGLRKAQRRLEPQFRAGDTQMLALAAKLMNAYQGTNLPEEPEAYHVHYRGIPRAPEEVKATVEEAKALIDLGIASKIDALMMFDPSLTREQAVERYLRVLEDARIGTAPAPVEQAGPQASAPTEDAPELEDVSDPATSEETLTPE